MTREKFRSFLAEVLMVDITEVDNQADLSQLGWDSLALLSVVSLAEETWSIELSARDLNDCVLVQDMLTLFDPYWADS